MTGNNSGTASICLLLLSFFAAAPVLAQLPNGGDAAPETSAPNSAPPNEALPNTSPPNQVLPAAASPSAPAAPAAPPQVDVHYERLTGPTDQPHLEGVHLVYGGELTLDSDQADASLPAGTYTLRGNVRAHETDTTLRAGEVTFGSPRDTAAATDALLTRSDYTIRAPRLTATPDLITAYDGSFTTVPNGGKADYYLRSQTITLDSIKHRGTLRNATLYLFGARLITIPRLTFGLGQKGGGAQRRVMIPTFGVSSRYGTFIAFGKDTRIAGEPVQYRVLLPTRQSVQATVTSQQTLYTPPQRPTVQPMPETEPETLLERIRAAATLPPGPLPEGDPLRFHDFLPDPNPIQLFAPAFRGGLFLGEDLSVHVAASGRRRNDLYVSRLPEVTLNAIIPLTPVPPEPPAGDPQAFRAGLHRLVLYAQAQETLGDYREQLSSEPYNIRARRARSQAGLSLRPLLIAANTVLLPSISISSSSYSGSKSAYRFDQINVAVNHYFSDLTAIGVQFLAGSASGDSPFNFDVLDTTREMDIRFQTGNAHLIAAGRVRYDLSRGGVIDYQAAVGPALRGFIPVFSYNFRTRSLGLGVEAKGLTF